MVPKRVLEEIRIRSPIEDVIGGYLHLRRAGANLKTLCPFHKEKTPSFHVNPQRQIYHCFGCGEGGDVFRFVMQFEGMSFMDAVEMLARRAGVRIEIESGEGQDGQRKEVLYRIHEDIAGFYERCLLQMASAEAARTYLKQRRLDGDVRQTFRIGYAPNRWDAAQKWAARHKYTLEQLEQAGLAVRRADGAADRGAYDRFRDRIMFPIRDTQGRVIAFSGRALREGPRTAKYVNSPETSIFRKGRVLYALDRARKSIVESGEAVLCEGQIDVIRCHQNGFGNAVASQGTAFTEEHALILKRYADSVVIVFDSDSAGRTAAVKTAGCFLGVGLAVRVAALPQGEDPDSLLDRQDPDAFRSVLNEASSIVSFQIADLARRETLDSELGAMRAARAVLETVALTPNAVQQTRMIQEAAERLRLPEAALLRELGHLARRVPASVSAEEPRHSRAAPPPPEELALCEHLLQASASDGLPELLERYLPLDLIDHPACRTIVAAALQASRGGEDVQAFLNRTLEDPGGELSPLLAGLLMAPSKIAGAESTRLDAVRDLLLCLWRRRLKAERNTLNREALTGKQLSRRRQITMDLKNLRAWSSGAPIIEMEMAEREG